MSADDVGSGSGGGVHKWYMDIGSITNANLISGSTFVERMINRLKCGEGSDVRLIFSENLELFAHKFVLATHSPVFDELLAVAEADDEGVTSLKIEDSTLEEFQLFLEVNTITQN